MSLTVLHLGFSQPGSEIATVQPFVDKSSKVMRQRRVAQDGSVHMIMACAGPVPLPSLMQRRLDFGVPEQRPHLDTEENRISRLWRMRCSRYPCSTGAGGAGRLRRAGVCRARCLASSECSSTTQRQAPRMWGRWLSLREQAHRQGPPPYCPSADRTGADVAVRRHALFRKSLMCVQMRLKQMTTCAGNGTFQ